MYNTEFKVKYNDIEQELIHKLKHKTSQEYNANINDNSDDTEYEYSTQDVLDICDKLYSDELLSVFGLEHIDDNKLNESIKYVYDIMILNEKFKEIIDELSKFGLSKFINNQEITDEKEQFFRDSILIMLSDEKQESIRHLILIMLFSKNIFYITHKCICQQIELGIIDEKFLVEIRKHSTDLLKNQFGVN